MQRAGAHWLSATDREQALAVGRAAVEYALQGRGGAMPAIRRLKDSPYRWDVVAVDTVPIANLERPLPAGFVAADGLHVTPAACDYIRPLIAGEFAQPTVDGLPDYGGFVLPAVDRRLPAWPG